MPLRSFASTTAVVTGGASGIGLAIAAELARRGADLALVDVRPDRLAEAAGALAGRAAGSRRIRATSATPPRSTRSRRPSSRRTAASTC